MLLKQHCSITLVTAQHGKSGKKFKKESLFFFCILTYYVLHETAKEIKKISTFVTFFVPQSICTARVAGDAAFNVQLCIP